MRCPTCGWHWIARPRWWQLWLWPTYWTRCPFLDLLCPHLVVDLDGSLVCCCDYAIHQRVLLDVTGGIHA